VAIPSGSRLDRYEILSLLGAGGMGVVYLASDTKLDRNVALKILPDAVASDQQRMRRFVQEAKAAAALNHPNIAHIYEIGEVNGTNFIAMEFVDGHTLRELIHGGQTDLKRLLKSLQQVAEGLAKAHAAGIVHRDLKPDNIMITRDGYAKILDFGLSKLVEQQKPTSTGDPTLSEAATAIIPQHSLPGTVMGTVGYMSPEQVQGKVNETDHRSDIFSLGCILFEAATGRKAFEGKDAIDSLHKIVHGPTPQIKDFNPVAPEELQRIIRRCLAKDPEKRYQTIKDVALELEELQLDLKGVTDSEYSLEPSSGSWAASSRGSQAGPESTHQSGTRATQIGTRPTSSAEYLITEIKRHKTSAMLFVASVVLLAGFAFLLSRVIGGRTAQDKPAAKPGASSQEMKISRLTARGKVQTAAISPDGKFLSYVQNEGEQQSLWIKQIATNSNVEIVAPGQTNYFDLTFTPDGNYVYYVAKDGSASLRTVFRVPTLGGTPARILTNASAAVSFSPDGRQFVFERYDGNTTESTLLIASADGTGERKLASRSRHEWFIPSGLAWSPDGLLIACGVGDDRQELQMTMAVINVSDGVLKELTAQRWSSIVRAAWLTDGSGIVFCARGKTEAARQIWQISFPNGEARRITHDLNSYLDISITSDSNALVAAQYDLTAGVWVSPNADLNRARQITSGHDDGAGGIAWTPDGQIVYASSASGSSEIWIMNQDGTNQKQLTNDSFMKHTPAVSPDGRFVVFVSERAGVRLWRIGLDGGSPTQLTNGNYDTNPRISPDGHWVVYSSYSSGKLVLWKVAISGGAPTQLTDVSSAEPDISPDGKLIACFYNDAGGAARMMVLPFEGGAAIKTFNLPQTVYWEMAPHWTPDGRALTYIEKHGDSMNLWLQPFAGGPPSQLTDFKQGGILRREWSRDGKQIAIVRGVATSDAVLISNFR
jgi:serine/threonine protein kinase